MTQKWKLGMVPTKPSLFAEVGNRPQLKRLLSRHVDMQFMEVKKMLMMQGFNFPLSAYLLDVISGVSVCFYNASRKELVEGRNRGHRFKTCLKSFYPAESDMSLSKTKFAEVMWDLTRNPLAHALGIDLPKRGEPSQDVAITKHRFKASEVRQLEDSPSRPSFCPATLLVDRTASKLIYKLSLGTLYWGTHRMIHVLFGSNNQVTRAEAVAKVVNEFMDLP